MRRQEVEDIDIQNIKFFRQPIRQTLVDISKLTVTISKKYFICDILFDISFQAKYLTKKTVAGSVDAIKSLDESLVQLAVSEARQ